MVMGFKAAIIKVTGYCNLDCFYCYSSSPFSTGAMDLALVRRAIEELLGNGGPRVKFIWHGGEPLSAGIDFFEKVVEYQERHKKPGQQIRNSIQTNATLIDKAWCEFFRSRDFHVGVSIDGPQFLHDGNRPFKNSAGSYRQVISGLQLLQENNISHGVLAVITKRSLEYYHEIFSVFRSLGVDNYDLLPFVKFCGEGARISSGSITAEEFAVFLKNYFNVWRENDDPSIQVRIFENMIAGLLGMSQAACTFSGDCNEYVTVNFNGDVYHCDWDIGKTGKCLGNLINEPLSLILQKDRAKAVIPAQSRECSACRWFPVCRGGCRNHYTFNESAQEEKYYFCPARKEMFDFLENGFIAEVKKYVH